MIKTLEDKKRYLKKLIVEKSHEISQLEKNYKSIQSDRDRHEEISKRLQSEMSRNSACLFEILQFINQNGKNYYQKAGQYFKNKHLMREQHFSKNFFVHKNDNIYKSLLDLTNQDGRARIENLMNQGFFQMHNGNRIRINTIIVGDFLDLEFQPAQSSDTLKVTLNFHDAKRLKEGRNGQYVHLDGRKNA